MSLASKIKSHWKLDEDETGGVGKDSASTYDLIDRNTVTSGTGKIGKCIFATASSQENVYHSDDSYFDLADGAGFSLWLKTESYFDGTSTRRALTKRNQYEIYKSNSAYSPDLKVKMNKASGNFVTTVKSGLLASTWYFVYIAVDGANFRYSVDGESLQTGEAMSDYNTASYAFELANQSGTGNTTKFWQGEIDEVSYWSSILSDAEIENLYASGSGLEYPHEAGGGGGSGTSRTKNDISISIRV